MVETYILNKNHVSFWLRKLKTSHQLIAPMKGASGDVVFTEVSRMHETVLKSPVPMPSPKEFLLPQMDQLFCYSEEGMEETTDRRQRVLFGVRPCDVSAVRALDLFYRGKNPDIYYESRRSRTVLIAFACNQPAPTCFCVGLGTGPFLKTDFDVQLTDLGDRFMVETASETGSQLIRKCQNIFTDPQQTDREDLYEARLAAQSGFEKHVNLEAVRRRILGGEVADAFWESVSERCFECGGCAYNCPVCSCFNVIDRPATVHAGSRMRIWDSCMFKGFTRMAGGVLPAEAKMNRTQRWFHHKLLHWPDQFGVFGCVGCGRCAVSCPGGIDMAAVALKIKGSDQSEEK